ncbi:MAG: NAD(P)-dependent oxidoreductase [Candidatus Sulfotelmatobacter sp.]|jgi:nucleoside-diphosphate-sugar epimerase
MTDEINRRVAILTGATGFLGAALVSGARSLFDCVHAVSSGRSGGNGNAVAIDLARTDAGVRLADSFRLERPGSAVVIHAAAVVDSTEEGRTQNAAMARHVATWVRDAGVGTSILVSSVSVYPELPRVRLDSPLQPSTIYGLGKLEAEREWTNILGKNTCIVRVGGIWGWQRRPTLFWNRLLLLAARGSETGAEPVIPSEGGLRNHVSVGEVASCLLQFAKGRKTGVYLLAGSDRLSVRDVARALETLPGSRLRVRLRDASSGADEYVFEPSPEVLPYLKPFQEALSEEWQRRPEWVSECA